MGGIWKLYIHYPDCLKSRVLFILTGILETRWCKKNSTLLNSLLDHQKKVYKESGIIPIFSKHWLCETPKSTSFCWLLQYWRQGQSMTWITEKRNLVQEMELKRVCRIIVVCSNWGDILSEPSKKWLRWAPTSWDLLFVGSGWIHLVWFISLTWHFNSVEIHM